MRRLVAAVLAALPFDPRSRRALDETLLDWAHEEASAGTIARRWTIGLRALVAVVRAVAVSSVSEVGRVPAGWLVMRLTLFALVPAAAMTVVSFGRSLWGFGASGAVLGVLLLPGALVACLPPALLLALAWRPSGRSFPAVGAAIVVTMATLVMSCWILPAANQRFGDRVFRLLSERGETVAGSSNPVHEFSVIELVGQVARGSMPDAGGMAVLLRMTGFAALAGAVVLFARSLTRRVALRSLLWLAVVPAAYLVATQFMRSLASTLLLLHIDPAICNGLAPWCATALLLTVSVALSRRSDRAEPATPPSETSGDASFRSVGH